jgi:Coenzyme PQQ synthesis protein D (PqqD)
METKIAFKINTPKVVQETIDGEVVIVHLEKGDYYSLMNSGADIWSGIEDGMSQAEIIAKMEAIYEGDSAEIASSVNNLIEELKAEDIIITVEKNDNQITEIPTVETKLKFEPPSLGKYTDMEELLALDPIHEVDEMGWPNAKIEETF